MTSIRFEIPGEPQSQQRHRTFQRGEFRGTYDPSEKDKKSFLQLAYQYMPKEPIDSPIHLKLTFYFQRPKSHYGTGGNSQKLKESSPLWHTSRPDTDNLVKFVLDALNTVFWRDDSNICSLFCQKYYSIKPRTEITIDTL